VIFSFARIFVAVTLGIYVSHGLQQTSFTSVLLSLFYSWCFLWREIDLGSAFFRCDLIDIPTDSPPLSAS